MKNFWILTFWTAAIVVTTTLSGFAQLSLGVQGGLAKANVVDAEIIGMGGVNLRTFTSKRLAFGIAAKIYADKGSFNVIGQNVKITQKVFPVTATIDYVLLTGLIRPYVGGDAGVYISRYGVKLDGNTILKSSNRNNFGMAPRAGIVFAFGNYGIQVEGMYNFVFNNKSRGTYTGSSGNMTFKSVSEFGGVNVGIICGLGKK